MIIHCVFTFIETMALVSSANSAAFSQSLPNEGMVMLLIETLLYRFNSLLSDFVATAVFPSSGQSVTSIRPSTSPPRGRLLVLWPSSHLVL